MTTSKREERERRAGPGEPETVAGLFYALGLASLRASGHAPQREQWPDPTFQGEEGFARFCRHVLGVELWEGQRRIARAILTGRRSATSGGRKVGKDFVVAAVAIWFFCTYPRARVRFTCVTDRQVNDVFWREVRALWLGHGRCVECKRAAPNGGPRPCPHSRLIPEEPGKLARTGLRADDGREIVGYTTGEAGGARGISGDHQLNVVDEASDVEDFVVEGIDGNMGGCVVGMLALMSNPSRSVGAFWRAFHTEREIWQTVTLSSRETPNALAGRVIVPGLATREWIREMEAKYGEGSDFVRIHVDGLFVETAQGKVFPVDVLEAAAARWVEASDAGPLTIGIDVAGESGVGDSSAFAVRRAQRVYPVHVPSRGLSAEDHLYEVLALLQRHKRPGEDPVTIVVDRGGESGARVFGVLTAHVQEHFKAPPFALVGVDSSRQAQRDPTAYERVRDELVGNLRAFLDAGGGLPPDHMLQVELNEFRWLEQRISRKNKLIDKREMRAALGRSPDRADAVALSCWSERHWRARAAEVKPAENPAAPPTQVYTQQAQSNDPRDWVGAEAPWDPYAFARDAMSGGSGHGR